MGATALLAVAAALALASCAPRRAAPPAAVAPEPFPPLAPPLDSLTQTASFGEYRSAHFHAGCDFSTEGETGHAVYAPLTGSVLHLRASGGGFGRSIILGAPDGRSIVFGHLDAFDEPLASALDSVQRATGQYEQDLVLPPGRLPVRAGQRIAWSGASGAGPPHLHLELHRGSLSLNALRFGLTLRDTLPPILERVILEPLDSSVVAGRAAPRNVPLFRRVDTLVVAGRARVWIEAMDPGLRGAQMEPYALAATWNGATVEARFDSVRWDSDMVAAEWVYDAGERLAHAHPLALWFGPGFRDIIYAAPPGARAAGVLNVAPGDPARPLALEARDVAGNRANVTVWIRGPRGAEPRAGVRPAPRARAPGVPSAPAETLQAEPGVPLATGAALAPFAWALPPEGVFERTRIRASGPLPAPRFVGLAAVSAAYDVTTGAVVLRRPARVSLPLPAGADPVRVGLYVSAGRALRAIATGAHDGRVTGESRAVGRYALYEDHAPPAIGRPRARVESGAPVPYSRWALLAPLREVGSGLDLTRTHFLIDGAQVPSEYDVDMSLLRWRPRVKPAAGRHTCEVIATDRAGNVNRATGAFVIR